MMLDGDVAIAVHGLSKSYRLMQRRPPSGLRETLSQAAQRMVRRLPQRPPDATFWALDDVSFEIRRGEVVGVVGRNGSGKSTLLKILSRITPPTRGVARIAGRVGALLEVGTGFHPDLTGLDNIFLSAAVMGMTRYDTRRKLDEIVEFADVAAFLDTPIKHYSSGMHMRLAFSVAAHLDPEILLVDEVLAVGDAAFQQKCLGKMQTVSASGRTVLFVSHSAEAVGSLCAKALLFEKGVLKRFGPTSEVLAEYRHGSTRCGSTQVFAPDDAPGDAYVRLDGVHVEMDDSAAGVIDGRQAIPIQVRFTVKQTTRHVVAEVGVFNEEGVLLFSSRGDGTSGDHHPGTYVSCCTIPQNLLGDGSYFVRVVLQSLHAPPQVHVQQDDVVVFHVLDSSSDPRAGKGLVRPHLAWETRRAG